MNGIEAQQNGHAHSAVASSNGVSEASADNAQILRALELIHDPRSKNEHRHEASQYLEQVKAQETAPYTGYLFASERGNPAVVRHFGLSLLETAIKHRWTDYQEEQSTAVREWVVKLAQNVEHADPLFVRNKVAQLWVEVAKRSWALDWLNMDEQLVELWAGPVAKKVLVLDVLETLSENSFGKEDTVTALRGSDLSKACVDIFVPGQVLAEHFPKRDTANLRFGEEGWLWRLSTFLGWCNEQSASDTDVALCAGKALDALKSVVAWITLLAVASTNTVQHVCRSLTFADHEIQLSAVQTLNALYFRINFQEHDVRDIAGPMYETATITMLKQVYQWCVCTADDIDEEKYLLCKRFAEMMHNVGKFLKDSPSSLPRTADIPNMLDLHLSIVQNESLHVSIPSLHLFAQILGSEQSADLPALSDLIGPLLEICTQRSIRYEYLPESSGHPALAFLNEDIETVPERHAFLGNYARYGKDIVVSIVKKRPFEALYHILGQADGVLCNPYVGMAPFGPADYKKTSIAALKVDAQCSVVDASLHAYTKWCSDIRAKPEDAATNKQVQSMNENLERWGIQLMQLTYQDPSIQQRVIQLIVEIAIGPLKRNEDFMIRAFQHVINIKLRTKNVANDTEPVLYQDVLKELQRYCTQQLQRIAMRASDYLIDRYDDLAAAISQCFVGDGSDEEDKEKCSSVLFVIIQRATTLDDGDRARRLQSFVEPFMSKWSSPQLAESLQAFPGFCDLLGLNGFQEYFLNRKAHSIRDWADVQLDEEGLALKARIEGARAALPLRSTKTYFSASLDRSEPGSRHYDAACALWANYLTIMLPNLLQMVGLAHIFSEPASWMHLPEETRTIPKRILKDRFWQVGISEGTREDFYNKVESTKTTLEGLASTIRGCLRFVRETSYRLITTMSLLGDPFYRFQELPGPLSRAVFENSGALSTHQTNTLIDMMKPIIEHCPSDAREHFLAPMLSEMFNSLDNKVRMEWAVIDQHNKAASASGDLVEEMKEESILRSMTYSCVTVVARLFDPNDAGTPLTRKPNVPSVPLRSFVLGNPQVFKSVILFCTHALEMHDSRACAMITRVLRTLVPEFAKDEPIAGEIREFMCTEVFRACITSLHDPYFVDAQNDLANLIASIVTRYSTFTSTPQQLLASLPGMTEDKVQRASYKLFRASTHGRQQRAIVLKLLEDLRGTSIHEQGKIPQPDPKKVRSAMQEKYMTLEPKRETNRDPSPDLGGVADMFA